MIQMMKYLSNFFDLILRNFISFFWDFNGGSTRKDHLQMLVLKSKEKMTVRWKRMPFNVTKTGVHHKHFYWPSPQAATVLQKSMYLKNICYEMCSWFFKKHFHWSLPKNTESIDLYFQFPKYRLFRCIKLSFY